MSRKEKTKDNFLERVPFRNPEISYTANEKGIVTLEIENKGVFNRLAQRLLKKPKISYVHLEEMGSFIWQQIDGKKDIIALGKEVETHFGEKAQPLYERLSKYIRILESYNFITLNK